MIGTRFVHVCEGTVKCPVGWSQVCDLFVCVIACLNNMQCVNMLC